MALLTTTSCSIYQSYGRKSFEDQASSANLNEHLQIQIQVCANTDQLPLQDNQSERQPQLQLIVENANEQIYQINQFDYLMLDKNTNDYCHLKINIQALNEGNTDLLLPLVRNAIRQKKQEANQ